MGRGNYCMQMGIFMKESELMIKQMELEFILILMELNMREIGKMINKMGREKRIGRMAQIMKETICLEKRKEKDY